ncbi:hypothetical protein EDC01DRAFT_484813 [Geopyxis carbonaria]|nr:hypothetical protein EDC01DRAFT_484813 [Geopyxis carbonaria]
MQNYRAPSFTKLFLSGATVLWRVETAYIGSTTAHDVSWTRCVTGATIASALGRWKSNVLHYTRTMLVRSLYMSCSVGG